MLKLSGTDRSQIFAITLSIGAYCAKLSEKQILAFGKNILRFFETLSSDYKVLFCHQFIEYDTQGNKDIKKLASLQKIKGSDKLFKDLADVLIDD